MTHKRTLEQVKFKAFFIAFVIDTMSLGYFVRPTAIQFTFVGKYDLLLFTLTII